MRSTTVEPDTLIKRLKCEAVKAEVQFLCEWMGRFFPETLWNESRGRWQGQLACLDPV